MTKPYFVDPSNEDTSNGRRPHDIKSEISPQPLIGSYSNFKLMLGWPNYIAQIFKIKTTSNGRRLKNIKNETSQQILMGFY